MAGRAVAVAVVVAAVVAAVGFAVGAPAGAAPEELVDRDGDHVFRYACVGDSNTWEWRGANPITTWCGQTQADLPAIRVRDGAGEIALVGTMRANQARIGATACLPPVGYGYPHHGGLQVEAAIGRGDVDAVVIALGTNDRTRNAKKIEKCIAALVARARDAGLQVFVATIPPNFKDAATNIKINKVNKAIRRRYPDNYVEFNTGFASSMFKDDIHFNGSGHAQAAANVAAALLRHAP